VPEEPVRRKVRVSENGPYLVEGAHLRRVRPVYDAEGAGVEWQWGPSIECAPCYELCRCGLSQTKPFCDGTERDAGFDGTEVADRRPTAERRRTFGDNPMVLTDDRKLCAHMAFCESGGGNAWVLAAKAVEDPATSERLIQMVRRCPSGRLQRHLTPGGEPVEEELDPVIGVVENGPYWVRGGIPVHGVDGFEYEVRNRITLCRCGHSRNKPFCDGSHWKVGFSDPWSEDMAPAPPEPSP